METDLKDVMTMEVTQGTQVLTDGRLKTAWCWVDQALKPCDYWDAADYVLPGDERRFRPDQAVKVKVTGRKVRYDVPGLRWVPVVRVAVMFVGDGEPDETVGGWALASTLKETF